MTERVSPIRLDPETIRLWIRVAATEQFVDAMRLAVRREMAAQRELFGKPNETPPRQFFNVRQAAEEAGVSTDTIRRAIHATAPPFLVAKRTGKDGGGRYLVSRKALEDWFDQLPDA